MPGAPLHSRALRRRNSSADRESEQRRLLYSVATALSTSRNLDETLRTVLKGLRQCITFDAATLFLLDEGRQQLSVKAALGVEVALDEVKRFRVGEGAVGWVVKHNRSALIANTARDPRYHATSRRRRSGALLAVPLRQGDRVIGALALVRRAPREFAAESLQLAEAIAGQAAVAIEHARILETERHFRRRAEALLAASQAGGESQDLSTLLASGVAQLQDLLEAAGCVALVPDETGEAVMAVRDRRGRPAVDFQGLLRQRLAALAQERPLRRVLHPRALHRGRDRGVLPDRLWKHLQAQTLLAVPVRWHRRLLVVLLCWFTEARAFQPEELELAQDLGAQFAQGIERLNLQREVREAQNEVAVVSERNRIARDLHDGIAQYVYALGLNLDHVHEVLPDDPQAARDNIARCIEQANHVLAELRTFIYQLRPIIMREKAIGQWVRDLCRQFERATGVRLHATVGASGGRELSPEVSIALFRIIQEALANIFHHAGAGEATLDLSFGPTAVRLLVQDRGRGFDPERQRRRSIAGGQGLANIRERVQNLGGVLTIDSRPGTGTRLVAAIPYRHPSLVQSRPQSDVA